MKYYIIKVKRAKIDDDLLKGIREVDKDAEFVNSLDDCDIAVMQGGWTLSTAAVTERKLAREKHKRIKEGFLFTDKYKVHLN